MISIIVPHYSTKKEFFEKCMQSLLCDPKADIEVLVVDDGSSEEFLKSLNIYTSDTRVRIIKESHLGVSHARNVGIEEAKGEWLMFVDSDDYLEEDYYSILNEAKENLDTDFILFNGYGIIGKNRVKNMYFLKEMKDYAENIKEKSNLMESALSLGQVPISMKCYFSLGSPCAKLINTKFLKSSKVRFCEGIRFAEDTLFSMNLILAASHIFYIDKYIYNYYMNEKSATGKYRIGLSNDMNAFFRAVDYFINENNLGKYLEEAYFVRAFYEVQRCIRQEFYHKDNDNHKESRYRDATRFIQSEPYRTAIEKKYPYMRTFKNRVISKILRYGCFDTYVMLYKIWNKIKLIF